MEASRCKGASRSTKWHHGADKKERAKEEEGKHTTGKNEALKPLLGLYQIYQEPGEKGSKRLPAKGPLLEIAVEAFMVSLEGASP